MNCVYCNTELDAWYKFCSQCGRPVEVQNGVPESSATEAEGGRAQKQPEEGTTEVGTECKRRKIETEGEDSMEALLDNEGKPTGACSQPLDVSQKSTFQDGSGTTMTLEHGKDKHQENLVEQHQASTDHQDTTQQAADPSMDGSSAVLQSYTQPESHVPKESSFPSSASLSQQSDKTGKKDFSKTQPLKANKGSEGEDTSKGPLPKELHESKPDAGPETLAAEQNKSSSHKERKSVSDGGSLNSPEQRQNVDQRMRQSIADSAKDQTKPADQEVQQYAAATALQDQPEHQQQNTNQKQSGERGIPKGQPKNDQVTQQSAADVATKNQSKVQQQNTKQELKRSGKGSKSKDQETQQGAKKDQGTQQGAKKSQKTVTVHHSLEEDPGESEHYGEEKEAEATKSPGQPRGDESSSSSKNKKNKKANQEQNVPNKDSKIDEKATGNSSRNSQAHLWEINSSDFSDSKDSKMTIVFHAVLAPHFQYERDVNRIFMRFGGRKFGDWKKNVVELHQERALQDGFLLVKGELIVPVNYVKGKWVQYKYLVAKKVEETVTCAWECLVSCSYETNRCLKVPERRAKKGEICHQYDDAIFPEPTKLQTVQNWMPIFKSMSVLLGRQIATHAMLPHWEGFYTGGEQMKAVDVINQIEDLFDCMTRSRIKSEDKQTFFRSVPSGYDFGKVLFEFLESRLSQNASIVVDTNKKNDEEQGLLNLASTAAIIYLLSEYDICPGNKCYVNLFQSLVPSYDDSGKKCTVFEGLIKHFPKNLWMKLADSIRVACHWVVKNCHGVHHWLFAVPLVHFLTNQCLPFDKSCLSLEEPKQKSEEWWGVEGFMTKAIRESSFDPGRCPSSFLKRIAHLFALDPLLKRTYLMVVPLKSFGVVTSKNIFGVLEVFTTLIRVWPEKPCRTQEEWEAVGASIKNLLDGSRKRPDDVSKPVDKDKRDKLMYSASSCCRLLEVLLGAAEKQHLGLLCDLLELMNQCISVACGDVADDESHLQKHQSKQVGHLIQQSLKVLQKWLKKVFKTKRLCYSPSRATSELKIWSQFLSIKWTNEDHVRLWQDSLLRNLKARLETCDCNGLVELLKADVSEYNSVIEDLISRVTFTKVAGLLLKCWPQSSGGSQPSTFLIFKHVLTGHLWPCFFERFGKESTCFKVLAQDGRDKLAQAVSTVENVCAGLKNGEVNVMTLELIRDHSKQFLDLCRTLTKCQGMDVPTKKRLTELEAFEHERQRVMTFVHFCSLPNDKVELTALSQKTCLNVSNRPISDLAHTSHLSGMATSAPCVTFFDLSPKVKTMTHAFGKVCSSLFFQKLWKDRSRKALKHVAAKEPPQKQLTVEDIEEFVWRPASAALASLCNSFLDGSITLKDVREHFHCFKDNYESLDKEITKMIPEDKASKKNYAKIIQDRIKQTQQYYQLRQYTSAATAVLDFKEAMQLNGDFQIVEDLKNQMTESFQQRPLRSMNASLMKVGRDLSQITSKREECLQAVVNSQALVHWLRETIKGPQELKVLVDLALISGGETDMETARITCLHSSCLGFAPLIFELRPDCGFNDLMRACQPVWEASKGDPDLHTKLIETNRQLEWLKGVKESHGSVAISSLMQAEAINARGVYEVGCLSQDKGSTNGNETLASMIRLTVPPKEGDTEMKTYTLDELKDLQSKLMLIAAKASQGKEEVDAFVEVFEGILRLARVYESLCKAGEVSHLNWQEKFQCRPARVGERRLSVELNETCDRMEKCLDQWMEEIHKKRMQYFHLNHYTTQQLLCLRGSLAHARNGGPRACSNLPLQVFSLLESVLPNVLPSTLNAAFVSSVVRVTTDRDPLRNHEACLSFLTPDSSSSARAGVVLSSGSPSSSHAVKQFIKLVSKVQEICERLDVDAETVVKAAMAACDKANEGDSWRERLLQEILRCIKNGANESLVSKKLAEAKFPDSSSSARVGIVPSSGSPSSSHAVKQFIKLVSKVQEICERLDVDAETVVKAAMAACDKANEGDSWRERLLQEILQCIKNGANESLVSKKLAEAKFPDSSSSARVGMVPSSGSPSSSHAVKQFIKLVSKVQEICERLDVDAETVVKATMAACDKANEGDSWRERLLQEILQCIKNGANENLVSKKLAEAKFPDSSSSARVGIVPSSGSPSSSHAVKQFIKLVSKVQEICERLDVDAETVVKAAMAACDKANEGDSWRERLLQEILQCIKNGANESLVSKKLAEAKFPDSSSSARVGIVPSSGSPSSSHAVKQFIKLVSKVQEICERLDVDAETVVEAAMAACDKANEGDSWRERLLQEILQCIKNGANESLVSEKFAEAKADLTRFAPLLSSIGTLPSTGDEQAMNDDRESFGDVRIDEGAGADELPEVLFDQTGDGTYLSLDELGTLLTHLSTYVPRKERRYFPPFMKRGRPNLVLVGKDDIFATVLSLFMRDGSQPLPTNEEVFICSADTTAEEIELLWRRALGDSECRLFCLVNADLVDYSVSQKAVDILERLLREPHYCRNENYGLAVMCSVENEDRAYIVAALDQYRLGTAPPCSRFDELQGHLTRQFRAPANIKATFCGSSMDWVPAAEVDPERLSVRVVSSSRSGVGKSLVVRRLSEKLKNSKDLINNNIVIQRLRNLGSDVPSLIATVPIHEPAVDQSAVVKALLQHAIAPDKPLSRIFHIDVSLSVVCGLDSLLFNLLVLGVLSDKQGQLWRRRPCDLYIVELTTEGHGTHQTTQVTLRPKKVISVPFYQFLPTIVCKTPQQVFHELQAPKGNTRQINPLFDDREFRSSRVQRVFQYLMLWASDQNLDQFDFVPGQVMGDHAKCLEVLLRYCGVEDPSWSEISHFVSFLNTQLLACEKSAFCDMNLVGDTLEGFRTFVVRFMILMSRDFATPSLNENSSQTLLQGDEDEEDIAPLQLRRQWENSSHPYIFFNQDHMTMTFVGFHIDGNGNLVNPDTHDVIKPNLMPRRLRTGLHVQRVDMETNYESWSKGQKIEKLCQVMGVKWPIDPDETYELTTDNLKKILAIHMRFRCGIPVVIMGETGCGKTRLIRYMCGLQAGPRGPRNMLLMKVHGGTTCKDIRRKVEQAEQMARANQALNIDTVLFFDEANTTDALGMIKEVMVDRRIDGRRIGVGLNRLQFIAACNPYRRHTDEMIQKLESAGLGYHVKTEETEDRLGHIPLRHLVYRVHSLPASMRPLVWDFGQLKPVIEELYTRQIVNRYILQEKKIPGDQSVVNTVTSVLAASQRFMREQADECSFVSLRDVERAMCVMVWFYEHLDVLGPLMDKRQGPDEESEDDEDEEEEDMLPPAGPQAIDNVTRALVLSIGVCYHARLQDREPYRTAVARKLFNPCQLPRGSGLILKEITSCQRAVLDELELGVNIARNTALRENVFMMVICIELRIPLFVVGKPGSSKSLAKTVVHDNMQGDAARSPLFKTFKQVHMASYQCSPLSTPDGIVATFRQCRKLQEGKNLDKFVSVVVLDEIGLAEDSPLMPLKTLHPLLEDGVTSSDDVIETDEKPHRVAFVGISNWALDPAKMNRGIMLSRGVPDQQELEDSAMGICSTEEHIKSLVAPLIKPLAAGYEDLYRAQSANKKLKDSKKDEFFGLRDFYSLIKMVYSIAKDNKQMPRWPEVEHAVRRNFGGLDEIDPVRIFQRHFGRARTRRGEGAAQDFSPMSLIQASLERKHCGGESRYLLILTENYTALPIIQRELLKEEDDAVVIFGSSFPKDQEYTQICRNINRIKVCMETGRTVILLNLENLYESLYDALNQYYVYFGGQKYVDLGLGSHRVKCRVDDEFRLIVIAERDVVYSKFPIPLINRLEKHYLVTLTSLTPAQSRVVQELREWVKDFSTVQIPAHEQKSPRKFTAGDAFAGFHDDAVASVVMQVCSELDEIKADDDAAITEESWHDEVLERSRRLLLQCAFPDAVARLPYTPLQGQAAETWTEYFTMQQHSSLAAFVRELLTDEDPVFRKRKDEGFLVQVTTHSRLLSDNDLRDIAEASSFWPGDVCRMSLQQFHTEQQFCHQVRYFFAKLGGSEGLLIVQSDSGDANANLIACARHLLSEQRLACTEDHQEKFGSHLMHPVHIILVVQLPRISGGCSNFVGFQGGRWLSLHIDELCPPTQIPSIEFLVDRPISALFDTAPRAARENAMEIDKEMAVQAKKKEEESSVQGEEDMKVEVVAPSVDDKVDIISLLRSCVQAVVGRIDDNSSESRATKRIELMLNLLPEKISQDTDVCFATLLTRHIHQLLKEKDERARDGAVDWLRAEARSCTWVQEKGTFRKALWQRVYSAVIPILAEVIAFIDRDSNLELVNRDEGWLSRMWLVFFQSPELVRLRYEDFLSPVSGSIRERVLLLTSGREGHVFQSNFPFAVVVKEQIDDLWKNASSVAAKSNERLDVCLRDHISNSNLAAVLQVVQEEGYEESAAKRYLNDFVHMVHKPRVAQDVELVSRAIISAARELHSQSNPQEPFSLDFAQIHVAHAHIQKRLSHLSQLVEAQPDVVPKLLEVIPSDEGEMVTDAVALQLCLANLEPKEAELRDRDQGLVWCNRILCVQTAVESTMKEAHQQGRESSEYGEKALAVIQECRSMWQRLSAVRLFIEHVYPSGSRTHPDDIENVFKLWKALGDDTDFTKPRTMDVIVRFLGDCSENIGQRHERRAFAEHADFRCRCNLFFMELVALFCFGDSCDPVHDDVFKMLMGYVICSDNNTQAFSPFDVFETLIGYVIGSNNKTQASSPFPEHGIDPTPVVRSFLLQQLLRSSDEQVQQHMSQYLKEAWSLRSEVEHILEVCLLFVQCKEDALVRDYSKVLGNPLSMIKFAQVLCEEASGVLTADASQEPSELDVQTLEGVAKARFALLLVAEFMFKSREEDEDMWQALEMKNELGSLFEEARKMCYKTPSSVPRVYLLKQLARRYGVGSVQRLANKRGLEWILPQEAEQADDQAIDRFVVYEDCYQDIREAITRTTLSANQNELVTALEKSENAVLRDVLLLLAEYREVTMCHASNTPGRQLSEQAKQCVLQFVQSSPLLSDKIRPFAAELLSNTHGAGFPGLRVTPGQSALERSLAEILVHSAAVLQCVYQGTLIEPLRLLMEQPAGMNGVYFPAMPDDNLEEAMAGMTETGRWYECPEGHPYYVGNCGRPMEKTTCRVCGTIIGGENHNVAQGNVRARRIDRTSTGYVLGNPESRPTVCAPERNLSPVVVSVLRLLMHSAMVLGATRHPQDINQLIQPAVSPGNLLRFLWQHLQCDIKCLASSLGRSVDESVLTVHIILSRITEYAASQPAPENTDLTRKEGRRQWETQFTTAFVSPVISDLQAKVAECVKLIVADNRLGNDPLMRQLYEIDVAPEALPEHVPPTQPLLWRYRVQVTIEHLKNTFQEEVASVDTTKFPLLAKFLAQEHQLRAVRFLPDIVKLQRLLKEKFHRRIDRKEAQQLKVKDFLKRHLIGPLKIEFASLIDSFESAWNLVRMDLADQGRLRVPSDLCEMPFDNNVSLAVLLPTSVGLGICSTALVFFLTSLHNMFTEFYQNWSGGKASDLAHIPLNDVTTAHLVAFHPERDLVPLILAHCNYSLEVGKGTFVQYNWLALQRHLIDRFVKRRPLVDFEDERFAFSKETGDDTVMASLREKLPQVPISAAVRAQILSEFRSNLSDVCDALSSIEIAFGFLSSSGGRPDMLLSEYLLRVLRMPGDAGLRSPKARQSCQLRHVVALWKLLTQERAQLLLQRKQDPFEKIPDWCKEEMSRRQMFECSKQLRKMNVERFVSELLELILLNLKRENTGEEEMSLSEYMQWHLDNKKCEEMPELDELSEDILLKHAVHVWHFAVELLGDKRSPATA